jgi:hypothetical protein
MARGRRRAYDHLNPGGLWRFRCQLIAVGPCAVDVAGTPLAGTEPFVFPVHFANERKGDRTKAQCDSTSTFQMAS